MINIPSEIKNTYKDYYREIQVFGNLYLLDKRPSNNLFNQDNYLQLYNMTYDNGIFTQTTSSTQQYPWLYVEGYNEYDTQIQQIAEVYTRNFNDYVYITFRKSDSLARIKFYVASGLTTGLYLDVSHLENNKDYWLGAKFISKSSPTKWTDMYISEYNVYEKYGETYKTYTSLFKQSEVNLYDKNTYKIGYLLGNGGISFNEDYIYGELINLNGEREITLSGVIDNVIIEEYNNADLTGYVSKHTYTSNGTKYLDAGRYIRICVKYRYANILQVEIGGTTSPYENYNVLESKNIFNIKEAITSSISQERKVGVFNNVITSCNYYLSSGAKTGDVRLLNLNNYIGKYLTISYSIDGQGSLQLKRGQEYLVDDNYIISNDMPRKFTFLVPSSLTTNDNYLWISCSNENVFVNIYDIQIELGEEATTFEMYGSTPFKLTEENECKILSINMNEKYDLYLTSTPGNKMTLELDNEKGYFTDYDSDNIIDKLNKDCYVDVFIKNNTDYFKLVRMNFDKISYNDYEKARLDFYSSLSLTTDYEIKDKNLQFNSRYMIYDEFKDYINDNYDMALLTNHQEFNHDNYDTIFINLYSHNYTYDDLHELLIVASTGYLGLIGASAMLLNNRNNDIFLKEFTNISSERITTSMQLEKPIVKREDTYKTLIYDYIVRDTYEQSTEEFSKQIQSSLTSNKETLILVNNQYDMTEISRSDITTSSNITLTLEDNTENNPKILILKIEGNIGENYNILISKSNISKYKVLETNSWNMQKIEETNKVLKIDAVNVSPVGYRYCIPLFIKKPVKSYVEVRIMGLPYLEVGDTIEVEQENKIVKFIITEITTDYSEGFIQTIKGYELDWTHKVPTTEYSGIYSDLNDWDGLTPSDNLYPRDDLYPY